MFSLTGLRRHLARQLLNGVDTPDPTSAPPRAFLQEFALDADLDFSHLGMYDFRDVAWSLDLQTLELNVSSWMLEASGFSPATIGRNLDWVVARIHEDDRPNLLRSLREIQDGKRRASEEEFRVKYADDLYHWAHVRALSVGDRQGAPVKLIGSFEDITGQMHAEEERDRLFNLSLDLLAVGGYDGLLHQLNPAWVRVLGWSRDDLMARPLVSFVHAEDQDLVARAFQRLALGEAIHSLESRFQCRDGSAKWLSLSAFPYPERQLIFSVLRDITGKKASEEQLLEYQGRLRSMTNQLSLVEDRQRRVLAEALHDGLAQELFGIRAKVTLLKYPQKNPDSQPLIPEILEILDGTMARVRTLSFELFPPVLHEVGLVAALEWLANNFRERTGLACLVTEDGAGQELPADLRNMAFQSVRELLANAHKHAGTAEIRIFVSHDESFLTILVEDDGAGFDVSAWQSDRQHMNDRGGFGLFSIRERLRSIDGRMVVDSSPGQGCRVFVSFPRQTDEATPSL